MRARGARRFVVASLAVSVVGAAAVAGQVVAADTQPAPAPQEPVRAAAVGPAPEVPALRTEFSRTRRLAGGVLETTLSATPLHFRDTGGRWRAIDNRLERQPDGAFEVAANDVDVSIPDSATGEVRFGDDDETVAFSLVGAAPASVDVTGGIAEYAEVRDDTDVAYEVDGRVLKETLTLTSADAPAIHRFDVDADGLQPRLGENGDVSFVDGDGRQRLGFQAPWMKDAAGDISRGARYELERVGGRDRVVLRLDADWLDDPVRKFPVVVDPTVYSGWEHVCEIRSGARSNTTGCDGALSESWVGRDSSGIVYRNPLRAGGPCCGSAGLRAGPGQLVRDLPQRPEPGRELADRPPSSRQRVRARRDLEPLGRQSAVEQTRRRLRPRGIAACRHEIRRSVRRVDGVRHHVPGPRDRQRCREKPEPDRQGGRRGQNPCRLLRCGGGQGPLASADRYLAVQWSYESLGLSDGSTLRQNMANGNLVLSANDLDWRPTTAARRRSRYFNAQGLRSGDFGGTFGDGTQGSFGSIKLAHHWLNDSYILAGPSGLTGVFLRDGNGGFTSPEGLDTTLTELPDGSFTLVFDDSGETWTFDADGDLTQTRQADGYTVSTTWSGSRIQTLSDSTGRSVTAAYDSAGDLRTLTDQDRAVRRYDYDGSGRLTAYTSPSGAQTRYSYDSSTA